MAPKKKIIMCQICNEIGFKYKCSKCMVVYCSVPCYKKHKEESCTHLVPAADVPPPASDPSTTLPSEPSSSSIPLEPTTSPTPSTSTKDEPSAQASSSSYSSLRKSTPPSIRALSTLLWPTESEDANLADGAGDPLEVYEPKPLRREELMAIATSPELRVLMTNPLLPPLLKKINSIPPSSSHHHHHNPSPLYSRDAFLKAALGVAPPSSSSSQQQHFSPNYRGRGGRGSRGRGGRSGWNGGPTGGEDGLGMTDEEMLAFRSFAACVEKVLKGVRDERRGLDWEDGLGL